MYISNVERKLLRLNLQFFGDDAGGAAGTDGGDNGGAGTDTNNQAGAQGETEAERLDRIIQSRVDRAMADERKKSAELQKKLDKLSKEKLTDDELKAKEAEEREKAFAQRERDLKDRENKWFAMKAIKEIGLDDGSDKSLELVDFVMADDEKTITARVKAFNELVKRFVSAEVEKKFKDNGRVPNGAKNDSNNGGNKEMSIAERLGKQVAETSKQTNSVLSYYTGGKK